MELRTLRYFLAVCEEENLSKAAARLYLTEPTLSRQIHDLEKELGSLLFVRGKKIVLTPEGKILRKRAEEMLFLEKKTEDEVKSKDEALVGNITIGAAETDAVRQIGKAMLKLEKEHPGLSLSLVSGDVEDILDKLDSGIYDFALICGPADSKHYGYLRLPHKDIISVLMRKDDHLARKEFVEAKDLVDQPLILSRQQIDSGIIENILQTKISALHIAARFNLLNNAALLVSEGMGYCPSFDNLINVEGTELTFRPFKPLVEVEANLIWKKNADLSKAARLLLESLRKE
ncbi:MAG: LysR family transcriptional regulator [Bacilli bacterium]|jgi:DNA-binding transcriptional LysR family regulator|nr:LysR family transcriptional regulator [Bacilli bacterium]